MKRIAFLCADYVGQEIARIACNRDHPIEFIATSQRDRTPYKKRIGDLARMNGVPVYPRIDANDPEFVGNVLESAKLDIVFLAWWPEIIQAPALAAAGEWINTHPSLLPFNRGKHPYYWAIVDGTPFGATIHRVDRGVDTGPVLCQEEIPVGPDDTGESLYRKSRLATISLFKRSYNDLLEGTLVAKTQSIREGTYHSARDLDPHSRIRLDRPYVASDLLNRIRGRSFREGNSAAWFVENGRRYDIKVSITPNENDQGK